MKTLTYGAVGMLALLPLHLSSREVIINIPTHGANESFVLDVQPEDTFLGVMDTICDSIVANNSCSNMASEESSYAPININFSISNIDIIAKVSKPQPAARNYYAQVTPQEKNDIAYILRTLANSSLIKIGSSKSTLEKAGDRIEHIHPLRFLQCIFTEEELKVCMRNLQGRNWVWKEFLEGLLDSLRTESARGNLKNEFITEFASIVGVDVNLIYPSIQGNRFEELVNLLIAYVPRQGGANRYNVEKIF